MDLRYLLAHEVAAGIISTGIEGVYGSVSCSTAGNYPSMGVSQWEGSRGDNLLSWIDDGRKFIGRTYSDIVDFGELAELRTVLDSEQGRAAQLEILAADCLDYVDALMPYISDSKCVIYAAMWCPTSTNVVRVFVRNRKSWGYDVNNLSALADVFADEYYVAAAVGNDYKQGYANRARATYNYLAGHDIDWRLLKDKL